VHNAVDILKMTFTMKSQSTPSGVLSVQIDGKTYRGSYLADGNSVTVTCGVRQLTTVVFYGPAEHTARMLLRELVPGGTGMN
jgi:hypothetical protein